MIDYYPFWKLLKKRGISQYYLINKKGLSPDVLTRMRRNQPLSAKTIDKLCNILDCDVSEIIMMGKGW